MLITIGLFVQLDGHKFDLCFNMNINVYRVGKLATKKH